MPCFDVDRGHQKQRYEFIQKDFVFFDEAEHYWNRHSPVLAYAQINNGGNRVRLAIGQSNCTITKEFTNYLSREVRNREDMVQIEACKLAC